MIGNIIEYYSNETNNNQLLDEKEWVEFWKNIQKANQKSLSVALLISSGIFVSVFLMLLIPLFAFNVFMSFLKSDFAKRLAGKFKNAYNKCDLKTSKNQAENEFRNRDENNTSNQDEEYMMKEMEKYLKRHENSEKKIFQELNLPDENKVPLVLVNEQIAESYLKLKRNDSMSFLNARNQIDIDEEVADIINKLTGTKLIIPEALAVSTSNIIKEESVNEEEKKLEEAKIEIINESSELDNQRDIIHSPINFTSDRYDKLTKPRFFIDSIIQAKDEEKSEEEPRTSSIVASKSSAFMTPKSLLSVTTEHLAVPKFQPKQQESKILIGDEKDEKDNEKSLKQIANEIKIIVEDYE
jgi:hypothetical protein